MFKNHNYVYFTAKAMADSILVSWSSPKDQSIKVRGYILGWGKGYPDVYLQKVDGKQRYFTIETLGELFSSC